MKPSKLLLTSQGLTNKSIVDKLAEMLGKPFNEATIVIVPTAQNPEKSDKGWVIDEDFRVPYALGWKNFEIVDIAAMYTLPKELWWDKLASADVLLFGGGNNFYLSYWLQMSGVAAALPDWLEQGKVYVGISAGSIVAGSGMNADQAYYDEHGELRDADYDEVGPGGQSSDQGLGLAEFLFRPHLNNKDFPKIRIATMDRLADRLQLPMYVCDDNSAVAVIDGQATVVSEGDWKFYDGQ